MGHIELAKWSDIVIIAPASANTIAKLCHGRADDLLSTVILATDAKVMLAPSMNQQMFASKAMKDNLKILLNRGIVLIEPGFGEQACGDIGEGRLAEPLDIAKQAADLIDEFVIYTAPIILGSDAQPMMQIPLKEMSEKISLKIIELTQVADDIKIRAVPL